MKLLLLSLTILVITSSCKKEIYGCTQTEAENYSTLATSDDGSCFYPEPASKTTTASITNWTYNGTSQVAVLPWGEITSDVIDNGAVIVYKETGTNTWSQLPLTIYETVSYSTTIQVSVTVGQVLIYITNSDLSEPSAPGAISFKVSVVL